MTPAEARAELEAATRAVVEAEAAAAAAKDALEAAWAVYSPADKSVATIERAKITAEGARRAVPLAHARESEARSALTRALRGDFAGRAALVGHAGWRAAHAEDLALVEAMATELEALARHMCRDLDAYTVSDELRAEAKQLGLQPPERLTRAHLVDVFRAVGARAERVATSSPMATRDPYAILVEAARRYHVASPAIWEEIHAEPADAAAIARKFALYERAHNLENWRPAEAPHLRHGRDSVFESESEWNEAETRMRTARDAAMRELMRREDELAASKQQPRPTKNGTYLPAALAMNGER